MKKNLLFIIVFLLLNCLNAQDILEIKKASEEQEGVEKSESTSSKEGINNSDAIAFFFRNGSNSSGLANGGAYYVGRKSKFIDLEGEVYLNKKWQKAIILTKEGKRISTQGRFRHYDNEMEILVNDEEMTLFREEIKAFAINGQLFVPMYYLSKDDELVLAWFESLSKGQISLYKRHYTTIQRSDYNPALGSGNKNDYLVKKEEYLIRKIGTNSDLLYKMKKGKGEVLRVLEKKEKEVSRYVKENNLRWNKEEDLVTIFNFYNELVAK